MFLKVSINNCSQTKFVAIIFVLSIFFSANFHLTDFSSDAFDFSSQKRDKRVAPRGYYVLLELFESNLPDVRWLCFSF